MRKYFVFILLMIIVNGYGQQRILPHDNIPGNHAIYKPLYQESYPSWAKMLYQENINVAQLDTQYKQWKSQKSDSFRPVERYYKIWRRAISPYLESDGSIDMDGAIHDFQLLSKEQLTPPNRNAIKQRSDNTWSLVGPVETYDFRREDTQGSLNDLPWQVNVYFFDVFKGNPDILYAGTETGFVNKSIDNGETWTLVGRDYPFGGGITAIAIDPVDENIVYVAGGSQIHKTVDGGETWQPLLPFFQPNPVDKIIINPENPQTVIAAGINGVLRSGDAGNNWTKIWNAISYDVHFRPGDTSTVYVISSLNNEFILGMSTDGGQSFEVESSFPENIREESGGLLAVSPQNPSYLYAVMLTPDNTPYLYKGNMDNKTWQLLATGRTTGLPMDNGQGFFDLVLEVSPTDPDVVYTGTLTLYKSQDGGRNFFPIGGYDGPFPIHPDIQCMQLLDNGNAWVATDGGFTFSTDNFTNTDNADARNLYLIGSDMWGYDQGWNEDLMVGGRYHNGNTAIGEYYHPRALRLGGAESPTGWLMKGKSRYAVFDDLGAGYILPKDAFSSPEGRFSFTKHPNMDEFGGRRSNLFFHPNYYEVMYLGEGNGIWKSEDLGLSFQLLHDFGGRVRYCNVAYSNPDIMYADVVDKGLFRSMDGGNTWEALPEITTTGYNSNYWKGRTFFAISPNDPMTLYACLQNGTFSNDIGPVLKSTDGGTTWEDFSRSLEAYAKILVVQPDHEGRDIVYLFTGQRNGTRGNCHIRLPQEDDWQLYGEEYPAGMKAIFAAPFYRDSKLRVAGNAGVWESLLADTNFKPILQPWTNNSIVDCILDTIQMEDHSIIDHSDCQWTWKIDPEPLYIESTTMRNPKIVLGHEGSYDITMSITKGDSIYTKTIENMIEAKECPSVENCNNPALIDKTLWEQTFVSSEEINFPGLGTMAFDGDPSSIWHTRWSTGTDDLPHELQINLGDLYDIHEFTYLPRQDSPNGRIKDYELYVSTNGSNWGEPVSEGRFANPESLQKITFDGDPVSGRYIRFRALSEVNDNPFISIAEIDITGCYAQSTSTQVPPNIKSLRAFPVPSIDIVKVPLPQPGKYQYRIFSMAGKMLASGTKTNGGEYLEFDFTTMSSGMYIIELKDDSNISYLVKVIKE